MDFINDKQENVKMDSGNEIYKVRVDENNWARCGKCHHKLYEIIGEHLFLQFHQT